jgi:hypothetical protein
VLAEQVAQPPGVGQHAFPLAATGVEVDARLGNQAGVDDAQNPVVAPSE